MCDRTQACSNEETCQLELRDRRTGMVTFEYYCKAHLILRVWELEGDDRLDVVDATPLRE